MAVARFEWVCARALRPRAVCAGGLCGERECNHAKKRWAIGRAVPVAVCVAAERGVVQTWVQGR